jgi:hypothetical protein
MVFVDIKNPAERKKLILLSALLLVCLFVVVKTFSGSSEKDKKKTTNTKSAATTKTAANASSEEEVVDESFIKQVIFVKNSQDVKAPERNIFSYYVPPPTPPPTPEPPPQPTAPPPLIVSSASPPSVYAQTGDFQLQVSGDKFVSGVNVKFNGNPLPTRFINAQQLSASVPGHLISSEGSYSITVEGGNGKLYSNAITVSVMAPPKPPYSFVGLIGDPRYNDIAILKKQDGSLVSVKRGETIGEWKVTNITDRAIELTNVNLRVKQSIPYTAPGPSGGGGDGGGGYQQQYNPSYPPHRMGGQYGVPPPPPPPPPAEHEEVMPESPPEAEQPSTENQN